MHALNRKNTNTALNSKKGLLYNHSHLDEKCEHNIELDSTVILENYSSKQCFPGCFKLLLALENDDEILTQMYLEFANGDKHSSS